MSLHERAKSAALALALTVLVAATVYGHAGAAIYGSLTLAMPAVAVVRNVVTREVFDRARFDASASP